MQDERYRRTMRPQEARHRTRREFLGGLLAVTGSLTAAAALAANSPSGKRVAAPKSHLPATAAAAKPEGERRISVPENLMREHGVLDRLLLVYEEGARRLRAKHVVPADVFQRSAQLIRIFIEDYHEQVEQELVFAELVRRGRLTDLVAVLTAQHEAGRRLTDTIIRASAPDAYEQIESRIDLLMSIDAFVSMYRPHEAHEETVVFPALYGVLSAEDLAALAESAEEQEQERIGQGGFERTVLEVVAIEKELEMENLARFTPR